jgi:hypothetical protein
LVQKLIALKFKQKFLIFSQKNYTPKYLGCYSGHPGLQPPRRGGQTTWAGLTAQGAFDLPGRSSQEASKRRTRVGIARLASRLSKVAVVGHPFDGENLKTSKFTLEGHVSLVI